VSSGDEDGLSQTGIVCAYRLGCGCDRAEIVGPFDLRRLWVQRVGELLEAAGGLLDFLVCVSGHDPPSEELVELAS
jgi:hypothetical protein